jgi:serine/threonine protein kinase
MLKYFIRNEYHFYKKQCERKNDKNPCDYKKKIQMVTIDNNNQNVNVNVNIQYIIDKVEEIITFLEKIIIKINEYTTEVKKYLIINKCLYQCNLVYYNNNTDANKLRSLIPEEILDNKGFDLLSKMLMIIPDMRITTIEALTDNFFSDLDEKTIKLYN